jgi:hypothetical protein
MVLSFFFNFFPNVFPFLTLTEVLSHSDACHSSSSVVGPLLPITISVRHVCDSSGLHTFDTLRMLLCIDRLHLCGCCGFGDEGYAGIRVV